MHYTTTERIQVGVVYGDQGHIKPVWFVWNGRQYRVASINHVWRDKAGREMLVFFSVSDEANTYLLCYNSVRMEWTICGVSMEG
jgi:hypothetical protein